MMNRHWPAPLLVLAAAGLAGQMTGSLVPVTVVLAAWLFWELVQSIRLARWLENPATNPPRAAGRWRHLFNRLFQRLHHLEKELRAREMLLEAFQTATAAFPEPVLLLDDKEVIQWYNQAAAVQLGLRESGDRGQFIRHLIRQPAFIEWLDSGQENLVEIESPLDPVITFRVSCAVLDRRRRLLLFRDISEMQQAEAMRRDFVANVSHELRTPLTVLAGYLETLGEDASPEIALIIQRMRDQAGLMQHLIDDLIELSRLQTQGIVGRERQVAMAPLLAQLLERAEDLSGGRHKITCAADNRYDLYAAPGDLESAFGNLLSNAVRYTPAGGEIALSWNTDHRGGAFSVKDTGIGIPEKDIPRLTERFYRVAKDRSRASGGSGLGLSIVKHALNAHQATLEITSRPGQGSTFTARFPAARLRLADRRQSA